MCKLNFDFGLLSIYFTTFSAFAGISLISPFFPSEAAKKGVSNTVAGAVFSVNAATLFLMNILIGKIAPLVGFKKTIAYGIVILGLSNIVFGLLDYITNHCAFVNLCFVTRIFEAIGASLLNTSAQMVVNKKAERTSSAAVAFYEACSAMGFALGPAIGSLFFSLGGFKLPFIVLGVAVLLNFPCFMFCFGNYRDIDEYENATTEENIQIYERLNGERGHVDARYHIEARDHIEETVKLTYSKLVKIPKVIIILFDVFIYATCLGAQSAILELYFHSFNVGPKLVGYMYLCYSIPFTILSTIANRYFTSFNEFKCIVFGLTLTAFGYQLIGPTPFYFIDGSLVTVLIALVIIGSGFAFAFIPTLPTMKKLAVAAGYTENAYNSSCISGLWSTCFSLGLAIGPLLGGALFQNSSAHLFFTVLFVLNQSSLFIVLLSFCKCCNPTNSQYIEIDGTDLIMNA